ncbi:MAG: PilZ domain-containing protein [Nitrospirae bacterium]|nr:PilZ domain-containing protein [Nitrospirota bacterium]MBI3352287.1 PilZ domain-containing protein [Nitrospirota bacterium]
MASHKRKFPRFPLSGLVIVNVPGKNLQFSGTIELIAMEGLGIYTKEKIETGTRVSLQIVSFTGTISLNYVLAGHVRNNDRQNEFGVVGIQFEKPVNSKDQPNLYEFLIAQEKRLNEFIKSK